MNLQEDLKGNVKDPLKFQLIINILKGPSNKSRINQSILKNTQT